MANYYRGDQPHLPRQELKHTRPKGSRNGYSSNPNYVPVGKPAKGKLINGRYYYEEPNLIARIGNTANKVRSGVSKYASTTLRDIRSGQAGKNVGNWLKDRRNEAKGTAKNVRDWGSKRFNEAKGTAKNVRDWGSKHFNEAKGTAKNIRDWGSKRFNEAKGTAKNVRDWGSKRFNEAKGTAKKAVGYITGSDRQRAKSERDDALSWIKRGYSNKNTTDGTRNRFMKRYTEKNERYNKTRSLGSDIENLVRGARDKAQLAGTAARNRVGKAGRLVGKAASGVRDWGSKRFEEAKGTAKKARDWGSARAGELKTTAGKVKKGVLNSWDGQGGKGTAKDAAESYRKAMKYATDPVQYNQLKEAAEKAEKAYNNSIKGRKEQADQFIKNVLTNMGWKKQKKRK